MAASSSSRGSHKLPRSPTSSSARSAGVVRVLPARRGRRGGDPCPARPAATTPGARAGARARGGRGRLESARGRHRAPPGAPHPGRPIWVKRVDEVPWRAAASAQFAERLPLQEPLPWIGWHRLQHVPAARWMARRGVEPIVRSDSLASQIAAARAGMGLALIPAPSIASYGLVEVDIGVDEPLPRDDLPRHASRAAQRPTHPRGLGRPGRALRRKARELSAGRRLRISPGWCSHPARKPDRP
jgi:hypothetical protein